MKKVKVNKDKLIVVLKENKEKHISIFNKAEEKYREVAIGALDSALGRAREGKEIQTYFDLTKPMNQTKDYDRAIGMLEMSIDDDIEISQIEYENYVLDQWNWNTQFNMSNTMYIGSEE